MDNRERRDREMAYIADAAVNEEMRRCRRILQKLNFMDRSDFEGVAAVVKELLGESENAWINPPFYCDYGKQIRVGKIGEQPGLKRFRRLGDVARKFLPVGARPAAVDIPDLIAEEVLAENHILHAVFPEQFQQAGEVFGVIFRLHAEADLHPATVFIR